MSEKPKDIDFGFEFDYKKIWQLELPVEEMEIHELEWNLDVPYLDKENTDDWNLTPRELIQNLDREPSHNKVIQNTSLNFPIDIYFHDGKWKILDGIHRFCKAILLENKTIKVRKVPENLFDKIRKD